MIVSMLIEQLQKLDPDAEVWFEDCWPCPNNGWKPNTIIKHDGGSIILVRTNKEDWEYFKDFGSGADEVVFCDYANVYDDEELHNND